LGVVAKYRQGKLVGELVSGESYVRWSHLAP